jgi:hypothetical protein
MDARDGSHGCAETGSTGATQTVIEPPKNRQRKNSDAAPVLGIDHLVAQGVPEQTARDWLAVRKSKRAPLTGTAWDGLVREAAKAGISAAEAVRICAERGWQGFNASWDWQSSTTNGAPDVRTPQRLSLAEQAQRSEDMFRDKWPANA